MNKLYLAFSVILKYKIQNIEYKIQTTENKTIKYKKYKMQEMQNAIKID